jgi:uncharacterized membrane protein YedE/YeeE
MIDLQSALIGLAGGALLGISGGLLLLFNGRVAGVSGVYGGLVSKSPARDKTWRIAYLVGLLAGGLALVLARPELMPLDFTASPALLIGAGLLVGFGTQLGNGCTSGHGICGCGRLSPRSMVATPTFILTGAIAVVVARHFGG